MTETQPVAIERAGVPAGLSPDDVKVCCATAYQHDVVALVLGDSYHPGGLDLTRRLGRAVGLRPGERVLDVASGPGSTAFLLAGEFGVDVDGVDLGRRAVEAANAQAAQRGLDARVRFHVGDAERLPLSDGAVDVVVCECALCTFPDKTAAAAQMTRVLRPGGRLGITDVTLDPDRLDPELRDLAGWIGCIADARPITVYKKLFEEAGLKVTCIEAHDGALARMVEQIDARLFALGMLEPDAPAGVDIDRARQRCALAARAVADGIAGYTLLVAAKPV